MSLGYKRTRGRKRHTLDGLRSRMAMRRTCYPGGGGTWHGKTGDGEAYHQNSDYFLSGWYRVRAIKAGQWRGPWVRRRKDDDRCGFWDVHREATEI